MEIFERIIKAAGRWSALAASVLSAPVNAQGMHPDDYTLHVLDAFYGLCLNPQFYAEDMADFALHMDWEELPPSVVKSQRPPAATSFQGWWAYPPEGEIAGLPFMAFTGTSNDAQICGAAFRYANADFFVDTFEDEAPIIWSDTEEAYGITSYNYALSDLPDTLISIRVPRDNVDVSAWAIHRQSQD